MSKILVNLDTDIVVGIYENEETVELLEEKVIAPDTVYLDLNTTNSVVFDNIEIPEEVESGFAKYVNGEFEIIPKPVIKTQEEIDAEMNLPEEVPE